MDELKTKSRLYCLLIGLVACLAIAAAAYSFGGGHYLSLHRQAADSKANR